MIDTRISNDEVRLTLTVRPCTGRHFLKSECICSFSRKYEKGLTLVSLTGIYRLNGIGDVRIFILGILSWLLDSYGYFCGLFYDIVVNGILSFLHKTNHYAFVFG